MTIEITYCDSYGRTLERARVQNADKPGPDVVFRSYLARRMSSDGLIRGGWWREVRA